MRRLFAIPTVAALCVLVAIASRLPLKRAADEVGRIRDPAWIPAPRTVRVVAMGQHQLLAEYYWLKAVQYMGEMALSGGDWRALYPLVDLTTELDPRFGYAYQVAGSNLAGLGGRFSEADAILQKGMRNLPERWSLPWTFSVNKFLYERDYGTAAEYARRAAEVSNRPELSLLAANLSLVTDEETEYRAAEAVLMASIAQAATPELRTMLEERLVKVRTFSVLSEVERAARAFAHRFGRGPVVLEELVIHGFLSGIPNDPSGGRIVWDLANGTVRSTVLGPREPFRVN